MVGSVIPRLNRSYFYFLNYKLKESLKTNPKNELHNCNKYIDFQVYYLIKDNMHYNYPYVFSIINYAFSPFSYNFYLLLERLPCLLAAANLQRI